MKKLLGYILVAPMVILLIAVFLSPIYFYIKDGEWARIVFFYGMGFVYASCSFGLKLLEESEK